MAQLNRNHIFVSYSHADRVWLEKIQKHLKPHVREESLVVWDDTTIAAGANWRDDIRNAIAAARVAVLLVSPDFLSSDFIAKHELPPLLEAAQDDGVAIIWVPISASAFAATEIAEYQAAHNPSQPLDSLSKPRQNRAMVAICERIRDAFTAHERSGTAESKSPPRDEPSKRPWKVRKEEYCEKLLPTYTNVRTLMHRSQGVPIDSVYVAPDIKFGEETLVDATPSTILSRFPHSIIIGAGGAGKSFLCKHVLCELARLATSAPVLVRLRDIETIDDEIHLASEAFKVATRYGLECSKEEFVKALRNGEVTLLLDGFDEIDTQFRFLAENALSQLLFKSRAKNVLVTSRPLESFFHGGILTFGRILPVDTKKSTTIVQKLGLGTEVTKEICLALENMDADTASVVSTPLMLTVFSITFDVYGHSLQQQMSLFYERAFDALWIMHDRTKDGFFIRRRETQLTSNEFQQVLGFLSAVTYMDGKTSFSYSTVTDCLTNAFAAFCVGSKANVDAFLAQSIESLGLIVQDGITYEFAHRSFQEYYAAHFFCTSSPQRLEAEAISLFGRGKSESVLTFIAQMDRDLFEGKVLIPTLDVMLGFSDVEQSGDFAIFLESVDGEIGVTARITATEVIYEFEWYVDFAIDACIQLVHTFNDDIPTIADSISFVISDSGLIKQLVPESMRLELETGSSRMAKSLLRTAHYREREAVIRGHVPRSTMTDDVKSTIRNKYGDVRSLFTKEWFEQLCDFRRTLGTRTLTTRRERIEKLAFGSK